MFMAELGLVSQLLLMEPGRFPQPPQSLAGIDGIGPPAREHIAGMGHDLRGLDIGCGIARGTAREGHQVPAFHPPLDGVFRDTRKLGGLLPGQTCHHDIVPCRTPGKVSAIRA